MNLCGGLNFNDNYFAIDSDKKIIIKGGGGTDSREIELANIEDAIKWRYVGETTWIELCPLSELKGEQGIQGERGIKGDKGDTGSQGTQGIKGDKGDPFTYADFTEAQLLALKGEQGIQGVKGDKGDTGAKGEQGIKGDTGVGVVSIALTTDVDGKVIGGMARLTDNTDVTITVTTE